MFTHLTGRWRDLFNVSSKPDFRRLAVARYDRADTHEGGVEGPVER